VDPNLIPLSPNGRFRFSCSPDVPCFNECCRDLNQFLTPYDILRLKNHLRLSSGEFLRKYTSQHTGPESGLPIVTLKPNDPHKLTCPFVTDTGCRVYENRPSSCRTYPLMRAVTRSRSTGEITAQFMVLRESHCLGFEEGKTRTLRQWIDEQGVAVYNENNDKLMQIISLKNRLIPGQLDIKSRHLFNIALYDLDNFRLQIQQNGLLDNFHINSRIMDAALKSDDALLDLGMKWIKRVLFNSKQSR
jgi:Fe-S-cluster containining protein